MKNQLYLKVEAVTRQLLEDPQTLGSAANSAFILHQNKSMGLAVLNALAGLAGN